MAGSGAGSTPLAMVAGMVLFLAGAAAVTPWLFQVAVASARGGGVARTLAVRRLRADGTAETRIVAGVVVAVAGVIALQTVLAGVEKDFGEPRPLSPGAPLYYADIPDQDPLTADETATRLAVSPAVEDARATVLYHDAADSAGRLTMRVGGCDALRQYARIGACSDGDTFVVEGGKNRPEPGDRLQVARGGDETAWTLPGSTRAVPPSEFTTEMTAPGEAGGVLATPGAISGAGLPHAPIRVAFDLAPGKPRAMEEVRTAVRDVSPLGRTVVNRVVDGHEVIAPIRALLTAAVSMSLAVIGLGLLISTVEQLRESRRPLAVLAASGVRRRTLAASVLYQAAIPLATGLAVAAAVGTVLGGLLLRVIDYPVEFDPVAIAATTGVAAAVVLAVTLLSLPALARLVRPDNLRAE